MIPQPDALAVDHQIYLEGGKEFEALIERLRQGKQQLEAFKSFLEDTIALEEDTAHKKAKLVSKHRDALRELMEGEEQQARRALGSMAGLKKTLLPKLQAMVKEQKKVKDAQKAALASTTKRMCDIGASLGKLAEKQAAKERELAGLQAKIALTAKDRERVDSQREKCTKALHKTSHHILAAKDKLSAAFAEWKSIADRAKAEIERHEEQRKRSLDELLQEYKACAGHPGNTLSRPPSTTSLLNPRSAYSASIEQLCKATGGGGGGGSDRVQSNTANPPPSYRSSTTAAPGDTVKALYPYTAQSREELSFEQGDVIEVLDRREDPWWRGSHRGHHGLFPSNFVRKA